MTIEILFTDDDYLSLNLDQFEFGIGAQASPVGVVVTNKASRHVTLIPFTAIKKLVFPEALNLAVVKLFGHAS